MKKQRVPKLVVWFLLAFFLLTLWGYRSGSIGMSENALRKENADYMEDGYTVASDIGESMAVFLQYTQDWKNMDVDVYVKRKGAIGWFFRFGGAYTAATGVLDVVYRLELEENQEYALVYMSPETVERIEVIVSEASTRTIYPEEGKPFAHIMEKGWLVTIYDTNGNVIEPSRQLM